MTHPSAQLKPEWIATIRDNAREAERSGKLHPLQLALVYEQGWFRSLVPAAYSGLQLTLPAQARLEEALAWADGSLGWVVTLCSGAGWFGGFLDADNARECFADPKVCLAGSGAPTGTATLTKDGYLINGSWKYASGVHHATHITANCVIMDGDKPVPDADGSPLIRPFVFNRADVTLLPGWHYMGMVATGSDAYEVTDLFVKHDRRFEIAPDAATINEPLYTYPFMQLAEVTLAANLAGMAVHFTDLCRPVFEDRAAHHRITRVQQVFINHKLTEATESLNRARREFHEAVEDSWKSITKGIDPEFEKVTQTSHKLAKVARDVVDTLYPYCGLQAANTDTELNRVWRDIKTAGQHSLLTFLT